MPITRKILIIDDDELDREAYTRLFSKNHDLTYTYQIEEAANSQVALSLLQENHYDCVLLDYLLPDLTGIELLDNLKQHDKHLYMDNNFIMLTGTGDEKTAVEAMKLGAADYLIKDELNAQRFINIVSSVIEKDQLEKNLIERNKQIEYLAYHDELTGIFNRFAFLQELERQLNYAKRYQCEMALLYIDLDKFKAVNDIYGHPAGDDVLKRCIKVLNKNMRSSDLLGRLGGDEFCLLLTKIHDPTDVGSIAQKIINSIEAEFSKDGYNLSCSIGICCILENACFKADELIQHADSALYAAKHSGRHCYQYFNKSVQQRHIEKLQIENSLIKAVKERLFSLVYQPIYTVKDQTSIMCGCEALLRCDEVRLQNISPAVFIPIAEQMQLMQEIGYWVIQTACDEFAKLLKTTSFSKLKLSLNISSLQLSSVSLENQIEQTLNDTGLVAEQLIIELTETAMMDKSKKTSEKVHHLNEQGFSIALDDFGTGYSSLMKLSQLPIKIIKIDRCFISGVDKNDANLKLVRATLGIAKEVGAQVIVEGVETQTELDTLMMLKNASDLMYQGYFFSKPMPMQQLINTTAKKRLC